jgi:hypothetical protein
VWGSPANIPAGVHIVEDSHLKGWVTARSSPPQPQGEQQNKEPTTRRCESNPNKLVPKEAYHSHFGGPYPLLRPSHLVFFMPTSYSMIHPLLGKFKLRRIPLPLGLQRRPCLGNYLIFPIQSSMCTLISAHLGIRGLVSAVLRLIMAPLTVSILDLNE